MEDVQLKYFYNCVNSKQEIFEAVLIISQKN